MFERNTGGDGRRRWSAELDDPRCPDCGGPIAATATSCLHCSADLTDKRPVSPAWIETAAANLEDASFMRVRTASGLDVEHPLDREGLIDNTLTVIVGMVGGVVIGIVGTFVLLVVTESLWSIPLGLVAWLGSTAYLVRRRFLLDAVAKAAYGVALVLLSVPVVALVLEGDLPTRGGVFITLLLVMAVPAGIAAAIGWVASRFVPSGDDRP